MRLTCVSLLIFAMACGGDNDSASDDSDGGTANGDAGDAADGGGGDNVDGGNGLCTQDGLAPQGPCPSAELSADNYGPTIAPLGRRTFALA